MAQENSKNEVEKSDVAKKEEAILKFWQENKIFEKTLAQDHKKEFVFYDGPPFATGLPHYGHILASTIKDVVPRYYTMRGYHVPRRWGWDCHGLPIENIAEKGLKISGKKQIENIGVKTFNEYARSRVLEYIHEWKKTVDRMGRWVDFDGSYKTMDNTYMESVWWVLKEIDKKGLLYEGTRVLPYCPRCETPIANSEIAMDNSYRDIKDISVIAEFELVNKPKTFVLAWTTTPWTLPGNVALAINPEIDYVEVSGEVEGNTYILAEPRLDAVFKGGSNVLRRFKGKELVGEAYRPLFDYYASDERLKDREKGWKIYPAEFVTTEDGTGVVHIAPAFGEDDMSLAKTEGLPVIWHVDGTGRLKPEVKDFAGLLVKPKFEPNAAVENGDFGPIDYHQQTDILIIKYMAEKGLLFAKEKITHSYPHCFRCETPLYYYALPAWFINIQKVKPRLLELNEKIHWVPEHLRLGRFGNSAAGAPDWNISRNRYWATPLPIWRCAKCSETRVVGSVEDLRGNTGNRGNVFSLIRHGEAENNTLDVCSSRVDNPHHLTERGREQVRELAGRMKGKNIKKIYASDLIRTKETAEELASLLDLPPEAVVYDARLREQNAGSYEGTSAKKFDSDHDYRFEDFEARLPEGESLNDMRQRTGEFLYEINGRHNGEQIAIVTHSGTAWMLYAAAKGLDQKESVKSKSPFLHNAECLEFDFAPLPHNDLFELDLHRPYIDDIEFACDCGGQMKRISEVVDCWLESGSMPFAANHYPFENKEDLKTAFPSQFVAEYIAQTRTWFYYMLVISTVIFDEIPFENVVTTGTVLAEDGQKMSKSKGNFPDPWLLFDKYGVDALRFYLLSSPVMRAEDLFFSEKGVGEVYRKIVMRLTNVFSFYQMYVTKEEKIASAKSKNILDLWILARMNKLITEVDQAMRAYELDRATRPIDEFIDDLSNWYLRRSRDRFKSDDKTDREAAIATTRDILVKLSRVIAPFMPFVADEIYRDLVGEEGKESVHLESWPEAEEFDEKLLAEMAEAREAVTLGLEARAKAGIKVRQPLASITLKKKDLDGKTEILALIKDELNVKEALFGVTGEAEVALDTNITSELKEEGDVRELIRSVQDLRKQKGLAPSDFITLKVATNEAGQAFVKKFEKEISKAIMLKSVEFAEVEAEELKIGELVFKLVLA